MKSKLTIEIEKSLLRQRKQGVLVCQEVSINQPKWNGGDAKNVDVLRYSRPDDDFTNYEIKITKADFNSKYGHNFTGNKNYYVTTKELKDYVKEKIKDTDIGLIIYPSGGFAKHCKRREMSKETKYMLMLNLAKALEREVHKENYNYRREQVKSNNLQYKLDELKE